MNKLLIILPLFFTVACTHYGIRKQHEDETYESYVQSVVDFNGGYKPSDYKCPHDYELVKFGEGYICPYWDSEWETEDTSMWVEFLIIITLFATVFAG